ncbi:hypothetical protein [Flavobacterium sp. U410]
MKKWILILSFAILIGLYFGLGPIFGFFQLLAVFGICTLILIVLLIIWKDGKKMNYAIRIYTTLFFGLIFSLLFSRLKNGYNKNKADLIAERITDFKNDFDRYPNSLKELKTQTDLPKYFDQFKFKEFQYSLNKKTNEFNLTYLLDGWHINEFNSRTKEWQSRD